MPLSLKAGFMLGFANCRARRDAAVRGAGGGAGAEDGARLLHAAQVARPLRQVCPLRRVHPPGA